MLVPQVSSLEIPPDLADSSRRDTRTRTSTASPSNGGLKVRFLSPQAFVASVGLPAAGLNHSTEFSAFAHHGAEWQSLRSRYRRTECRVSPPRSGCPPSPAVFGFP